MSSIKASIAVSVLLVTIIGSSDAVAVDLDGDILVGVSLTDNIFLSQSPNETDELVYRVSPTLKLTHFSPALDAKLSYTYDWYQYQDLGVDSEYHIFDGNVTGKLFNDSFTVQLGGKREPALRDPNEGLDRSRISFSNNLISRDEVYVNPRISRDLGSSVSVELDYRYTDISYDESEIQGNENQNGKFRLDNYRRESGLSWALMYDWQQTDYDLSPMWEFQKAGAELGFWVNAKTRLFGSGGKESSWDDLIDRSLQDNYWEAGVSHQAGENLKLEIAAGDRSFGNSWRAEIDLTFKRGNTRLSYNESPMTTGSNQYRIPGVIDLEEIGDVLTTPGASERYISEKLQWSLDLESRRSNFSLVVIDEKQSGRFAGDGTPLTDRDQFSASASVVWQMGAKTEFEASASTVTRETGPTQKGEYRVAQFATNYRLGARTTLALTYRYADEQPSRQSLGREYIANVVSLFATYSFLK